MFQFPEHSLQQITGSYKQSGLSNTGGKWQLWNPISSTAALTPWSREKSKPGEEPLSENGLANPRDQSSVHHDSQPWGSPTGSGCLAKQSPPETPDSFFFEAQGAQMKTGWLPCPNKSQAWRQGERGLGQVVCKKDSLFCRCRPLPGSQLRSYLPEPRTSMGWARAQQKSPPPAPTVPLTISNGNWGQWTEHRPTQDCWQAHSHHQANRHQAQGNGSFFPASRKNGTEDR